MFLPLQFWREVQIALNTQLAALHVTPFLLLLNLKKCVAHVLIIDTLLLLY